MFNWFKNWLRTYKYNRYLYTQLDIKDKEISRLEQLLARPSPNPESPLYKDVKLLTNELRGFKPYNNGLEVPFQREGRNGERMSTLTWHEERLLRIELSHYKEKYAELLKAQNEE